MEFDDEDKLIFSLAFFSTEFLPLLAKEEAFSHLCWIIPWARLIQFLLDSLDRVAELFWFSVLLFQKVRRSALDSNPNLALSWDVGIESLPSLSVSSGNLHHKPVINRGYQLGPQAEVIQISDDHNRNQDRI
ncbi:hypothetical protein VNO77_31673 [Canavalia gladiata]|uniref:Uncharacterized protein n=1 Tax=Canavalia gladiata TaxID=3824 RepID=A0AAN9KR63_CANGL